MNGEQATRKRRALILAGGGLKVAYQAGVLQVWLDEAGLDFDLADGASGGTLNLAMYCQGMSGKRIADNWRNMNPVLGLDFNWQAYLKLFHAVSLFEMDNFRKNIFQKTWGLDWDKIRASQAEATFNIFNFSKFRLEVFTPEQMSEDHLVACGALPMWFPPVTLDGDIYIDSVYMTDANIEEAIRRGADEVWIIWTVTDSGKWEGGFVNEYFQIIEATANGHLNQALERIKETNAAVAQGKHGWYGRHIDVKMIKSEVALHYLINFSQDRVAEAVNAGVQDARQWCRGQGIEFSPIDEPLPASVHTAQTSLQFTEEMKGYVSKGESDFDKGYKAGRKSKDFLMFHLTMHIEGVNRFVVDPKHEAGAKGWVEWEGQRFPVEKGVFNLFVDEQDPTKKRMLYRLFFRGNGGQELTLSGFKVVEDDPGFDLWSDTTTLYTRIYKGFVNLEDEGSAGIVASGILKLHMKDFLKQLTTLKAEGSSLADRSAAITRFGKLFLGDLWDVYARDLLSY